jgi:hypothetical protein
MAPSTASRNTPPPTMAMALLVFFVWGLCTEVSVDDNKETVDATVVVGHKDILDGESCD